MTTPGVKAPTRLGHEDGRRAVGRRAVALTLAAAGVLGIAAGAAASRVPHPGGRPVAAVQGNGAPATDPRTRPTASPTPAAANALPTTTAEPITQAPRPTTSRTPTPTTSAGPPPLDQALLRSGDWRRVGLGSAASSTVRRTISQCQAGSFGSASGVRSTRYSRVTSGALTGAEAVAETSTPAQADALLRAVVAWRETCNPSEPGRARLSTSALVRTSVAAPREAYRWTFVFDTAADYGNSLIEELIVSRSGNRVAVVVVSTEVPMATSRTIKEVDMRSLARISTDRLA
ncbi:hypothetical protein [Terrabacter sp. 2RAF25]|uniref:hypothetical protein n=1 Tax=Terrabacter sp. 2RAF25 TaxID=3232998 RepID=UPI003F99F947